MVTYKTLKQTNSDYDLDLIERQYLLYQGGYQIMAQADRFLPKLTAEAEQTYQDRLQSSSYVPYLSQFIDYFTSFLFSKELRVTEGADQPSDLTDHGFYQQFAADCDLSDNSLHSFIQDVFQDALIYGKSYVGIDLPQIEYQPTNLLEEEALGKSRAYLYRISNKSVIDWKLDDEYEGKYQWVKMRNDLWQQPDPLQAPVHKVQFIVWTMDNGFAKVQVFESQPIEKDEPQDEEEMTLVKEVITSFDEIPIFCMSLDEGLAIGNKIGPICVEYYQRRSLYVTSQNKSLIAIPIVKLGANIPPIGGAINDAQMDPARGDLIKMNYLNKGYSVIGADDSFEIVETEGKAHATMNETLEQLSQLMHQLVHQMANSVKSNTSQARSAQALQESRFATEIVLSSYYKTITDFVRELYECIAQVQGDTEAVWSVAGLSINAPPDKSELLAEAQILPQLSIPSETFKKKYAARLALALLDGCISPEEADAIVQEIEQSDMPDPMPAAPPEPAMAEPAGNGMKKPINSMMVKGKN